MQRYSNPTRRNKEDDITIFENGRRPPFFSKGRQSQFLFKWKMTSKIMQLKTMNLLGMEDHLIFFLLRKTTLKQVKVLSPDVFVPVTFI
jgi:hypothetical protein